MSRPKRVAVIGGGIIGVSSAVKALETVPNIEITLIAQRLSPHTTGDGSAGYWSPYLVGDVPPHVLRFWCEKTFEFLKNLYKSPEASQYGIGILSAYRLSETEVEKPPYHDVFFEWRELNPKELSLFPARYKYGVFSTSFYAECTKLLPMLMKRFKEKGGKIIQMKVNNIAELAGKFDFVINCPGVQAMNLVPDPVVTPIRGQVMRVKAPWIKHAVMAGDYYILPNSEEIICGGTHQEGNWDTKVDPEDRKRILFGCRELIPSLKHAKIVKEWVGLRPGRPSPRLERETITTNQGNLEVIHNYGHGGSGVTLFWGCAISAAQLLQDAINDAKLNSKL